MSAPLPRQMAGSLATGGAASLRHARLALPPRLDWQQSLYTGARLQGIDSEAALRCPGAPQVVQRRHLVAVVADSDEQARQACSQLRLRWSEAAPQHGTPRVRAAQTLHARGQDSSGLHDITMDAHYQWRDGESASSTLSSSPFPFPATGIVAMASPMGAGLRLDLPFGNPALIAMEVAALLSLPVAQVEVRSHRPPASAQERSAASDVAGVVALLALQCGQAVSLVLEPTNFASSPTSLQLHGELDQDGRLGSYHLHIEQDAPPPPLAWLLTETAYALEDASDPRDGAALASPYDWQALEIIGPQGAAIPLAASTFAQEIFFDELAQRIGEDAVQYRLQHLPDAHGAALVRSVAEGAGWNGPARQVQGGILRGRGFAYASTLEQEQGQPVQSWSAWVADVEYDRASGELSVTRVTAGHDQRAGTTAAAAHAADDLLDEKQRALLGEQARLAMAQTLAPDQGFDAWSRELRPLPGQASASLPQVDLIDGGTTPALRDIQLKAGGAFTLPAAAAISNAIHAATGVRLREAPFSGEQIRLALEHQEGSGQRPGGWRRLRKYGWLGGAAAALGATLTLAMPWRAEIAPVARPAADLYSAATIERGRRVALAGDCAVCHTAPGGIANAGGHALQTPFGTVYSTNITPDEKTGIGNWSYAAFERAMREGIHRDGRHLYPAFPYTAFAKISEADMQSLYAYLMAQPAVSSTPPENDLRFPFNMRPLLAGWNLLFHKNEVFQSDPDRSALWNRGAYLVEGAGHCTACHSPRNALGAEQGGRQYLGGGTVDGWEAPALTALSKSPTPWTEDELFSYLRSGFSDRHGIAAGPMAPVVAELAQLPAGDVRAIAHYLASFQAPAASTTVPTPITTTSLNESQKLSQANGKRLFQGACAACHIEGTGPTLFGVRPSLRVNTNLHSDTPDNLIHVILHGIREPANPALGYMPGFANSFSDAQVGDLLAYLRSEFAAGKPAWEGVPESIARSRAQAGH